MKNQLIGTAKAYIGTLNSYFGIENKQMAIWFYGGISFPILCAIVTILVSVVIK